MPSNGACAFQPSEPSPWRKRTLRIPSSFSRSRARVEQRLDALDAVEVGDERREHRGLVAAAGTDLEDVVERRRPRAVPRSCARRCRAGRSSGRSRSGARCPRRRGCRALHRRRYAAVRCARDRAPRGWRCPGRASAAPADRAYAPRSCRCRRAQVSHRRLPASALTSGSARMAGEVHLQRRHRHVALGDRCRSRCPGPASCSAPAGPTQYTGRPRGSCARITGSERWRYPSRSRESPAAAREGHVRVR